MNTKWQRIGTVFVGGIFLYAGFNKIYDPERTTASLRLIWNNSIADSFLTCLLISAEIVLGLGLLLDKEREVSTFGSICCLSVFTLYLGYLATLAQPPTCGCGLLTNLFKNNRHGAIAGICRNLFLLTLIWPAWKAARQARLVASPSDSAKAISP